MQNTRQAFLDYWQARNPRERIILASLAALVLLTLLYAYLWQPLAEQRAALRKSLPAMRIASTQFQAQADEAARLKAQAAATTMNVLDAIESGAKARNLRDKLASINAVDGNHVRMVSAGISFDDWLSWAKELQLQGIRIDSVQINRLPDSTGQVKLLATFSGPGK